MRIFLLNILDAEREPTQFDTAYDEGFYMGQLTLAKMLLQKFFGEGARIDGLNQYN